MNGNQTLIVILGLAAIAGGGWSLKTWLAAQSRGKEIEFQVKVNERGIERDRIITELANQNAQLAGAKAALEQINRQLICKAEK